MVMMMTVLISNRNDGTQSRPDAMIEIYAQNDLSYLYVYVSG